VPDATAKQCDKVALATQKILISFPCASSRAWPPHDSLMPATQAQEVFPGSAWEPVG